MINSWKKLKRSGTFHRHVRKQSEQFMKRAEEIENELIANRAAAIVRPIRVIPGAPPIMPTAAIAPSSPIIFNQAFSLPPGNDPSNNSIATSSSGGMCLLCTTISYIAWVLSIKIHIFLRCVKYIFNSRYRWHC